jgi:hypothetical protein
MRKQANFSEREFFNLNVQTHSRNDEKGAEKWLLHRFLQLLANFALITISSPFVHQPSPTAEKVLTATCQR